MFHRLLHTHNSLDRDGVGEITLCTHRLRGDLCSAWFRPDYSGAGWYQVSEDMVIEIAHAHSALEAMSIVRRRHG